MSIWDHVQLGVLAVFQGPALFELAGVPVPVTLAMIASGFFTGIAAGATPGLAGPMVMAVALPILISVFGYEPAALLPRAHGVHDNGIDLGPATGARGFAGALAAGYDTACFGKAHFAPCHTFGASGMPESLISSADYGPDWYGPCMGFAHVEIMVGGHNRFPPEAPPKGRHYERQTAEAFETIETDTTPTEDVRDAYPFLEDRLGDYSEFAPG